MNRNSVSDQDWYRLQLPENGTLRIEFEGEQPSATTTFDMQFQLSFTTGTVISTNAVPIGANRVPVSSVIEIPCRGSGGVYNLRLTNGGACDISYRFRYVVVAPVFGNDPEPNNGIGQAVLVGYDTQRVGQLNHDFDGNIDVYRIDPPLNGVLSIDVEAEHSGASPANVQVVLQNSAGTVLATWNPQAGANGSVVASELNYNCLGNTTFYYLSFSSSACGTSYRWKYTVDQPAFGNDVEPNQSTSQAILLPLATAREGQINFFAGFNDNTDFYRIDMPGNGTLNLTVEAEHAGTSTTENLEARIFISSGTVITTWNAPVGAGSQAISTTFQLACQSALQPVFLRLQSSVCGTSYRVSWTYTPSVFANDVETNNGTGSAIVLPVGTAGEGGLNFQGADNVDFYRMDMPGNGTLNLTVEAEHAGTSTTENLEARISISSGTVITTWNAPVGAGSQAISTTFQLACQSALQPVFLRLQSSVCGTSYRVSWTYTAPVYANDLEPNNSVGSGTDIDLNAAAQDGQIGFGATTDADVYHFTHPGGPWSVSVNAEHSGAGSGTMTLELYNNFSLLQTYTVNVGGSSTPLLNNFSLPSLDAGTLYRLRFAPVTCGVSYRILCYDDDNDGTCNAFDLCAGGPEPGTPCDDGTACTTNDVIQSDCSCAGTPVDPNDGDPCTVDTCDPILGVINTFQDSDGDGICDDEDACPLAVDGIANFDENTCACEKPKATTCTRCSTSTVSWPPAPIWWRSRQARSATRSAW